MKKFKRILLVDDDETSNLLTSMIIADMNISEGVDVATNGEDALSHLIHHCSIQENKEDGQCPELILLDINMPIMDGFEFLEAYSKRADICNNIPVVMLSSSNNSKDHERASAFNVKGYIVKPLNEEKLQQLLS